MQEVAEDNIDDITQPTDLFTHPDKLDPTELAEDGTTLEKSTKTMELLHRTSSNHPCQTNP